MYKRKSFISTDKANSKDELAIHADQHFFGTLLYIQKNAPASYETMLSKTVNSKDTEMLQDCKKTLLDSHLAVLLRKGLITIIA